MEFWGTEKLNDVKICAVKCARLNSSDSVHMMIYQHRVKHLGALQTLRGVEAPLTTHGLRHGI